MEPEDEEKKEEDYSGIDRSVLPVSDAQLFAEACECMYRRWEQTVKEACEQLFRKD